MSPTVGTRLDRVVTHGVFSIDGEDFEARYREAKPSLRTAV